jgi:hypothetical protein
MSKKAGLVYLSVIPMGMTKDFTINRGKNKTECLKRLSYDPLFIEVNV